MAEKSRSTVAVVLTVAVATFLAAYVTAYYGLIWSPIPLAEIGVVAMLIGGRLAVGSTDTASATKWEGVAHGIPALIVFVILYFVVPRYKRLFEDVDIYPNPPIILVSDWVVNYYYAIFPLLVLVIVADLHTFHLLHRDTRTRPLARWWVAGVSILLLVLLFGSINDLMQPMLKVFLEVQLSEQLGPI
jgi:hypothetical protein